ncbi:hypothetical protein HC928_12290 [bacterium]|nr:hypothetical protein [bacterium]
MPQSPANPSAVKTFNQAVTQHIYDHSEFGYSEAEVYLTILANIPNQVVYEFGDRTCETLRYGGSIDQINEAIESQFTYDDQRMTYTHIARVAEENLCPASSFPAASWRRSLFFWKERFNGGQPF